MPKSFAVTYRAFRVGVYFRVFDKFLVVLFAHVITLHGIHADSNL